MTRALVVGGTRFIGRHTVPELTAHDYDVTIFTRGNRDNPFTEDPAVEHVIGDRREPAELQAVRDDVDPDVVIDCVAYFPRDVREATDVFSDADAYVYVSSGAAYGAERVPKREDETPLAACSSEQATTDARETYGPRKAEGDREVFRAAEGGVRAMSVRPTVVYGPYDYTERFAYWVDRVESFGRVVIPSDGLSLWQMAFVEDVASSLRIVAERGSAGEAYNVGDEHAPTLGGWLDLLADACETTVEQVGVSQRELATEGLDPGDFPLYRSPPHLLSTAKLRGLGWESTPHAEALSATVEEHLRNDRTGREYGPDRTVTERLLERSGA